MATPEVAGPRTSRGTWEQSISPVSEAAGWSASTLTLPASYRTHTISFLVSFFSDWGTPENYSAIRRIQTRAQEYHGSIDFCVGRMYVIICCDVLCRTTVVLAGVWYLLW